ncbi:MAG: hypothetical protein A2293_00055 [Elusimicrobia bacterium RIFOXYB2_FULL_49_7]|nr:MAG: hypothetical protein A2293_00055 [Elusimicrobia bacterium RIFOXYB2_FULL_49_7]
MRIGFFQRDLPSQKFGGVANQVHLLANGLSDRGESVTVFTLSPPPGDARYQVHTLTLPLWAQGKRVAEKYLLGRLFSTVDLEGFDLVHAHGDNYLLRFHPQVRTYYGSALGEAWSSRHLKRGLSQLLFYGLEWVGRFRADRCVAISPETKRYIKGIDQVIPCGIDLERFKPGFGKSREPSLLFVGTLQGRKRGVLLLRCFETIRKTVPDAQLWMVTPEPVRADGVLSFTSLSEAELIERYQQAWVYCQPSRYEGFGVPVVEAMACGTPVVATRNHGSSFVLEQGKWGCLTEDVCLTETLLSLLTHPEARMAWQGKGLERAREFDIRNVTEHYVRLYHELVASQL